MAGFRIGNLEINIGKTEKGKEYIPDGKPNKKNYPQAKLDALRSKVNNREKSAKHREAREILNLAFLMGDQDAEINKSGELIRSAVKAVHNYSYTGSADEGSLALLDAMEERNKEFENLLIQPFLQMAVKASETPFKYIARPISPSPEDAIKAKGSERFIKVASRDKKTNFAQCRLRTMINTAIAGNHFLWPIFNDKAGPRRIVYKTSLFENQFPLVDNRGQPIMDGRSPLYAEIGKNKQIQVAYQWEGELEIQHIPLRNVLVPGGYTYLEECPDILVKVPIRIDNLDYYKETSLFPIKGLKDKLDTYHPNKFSFRESLLMRLQDQSGVNIGAGYEQDEDSGDGEFITLYHYLEKPTEQFPTGRWLSFVMGSQQFHNSTGDIYLLQEFPLPDEGLEGFPLVENSGPKIDGRFQGLTLLEFGIPAQVRHNKLLSMRMNKIERASEPWLMIDKRHTPDFSRIPHVGGVWRYSSVAGGKEPYYFQPPALPSELFQEDVAPQRYIESLFGIWNLKYPQRSDRTATEIAVLAQESANWVRDYGVLGQARTFSQVAYKLVRLFQKYGVYGKYGQILNRFNQWERELFLRSDIDCTDIQVDESALLAQDKMLQQQKLQLAVQINPEFFQTPEGKKVSARVLDLDDIMEGSEDSYEKSNAMAENGELYSKLKKSDKMILDKQPLPDEDDIIHVGTHLGILSEPIVRDLPQELMQKYARAIVLHLLMIHYPRLKRKQDKIKAMAASVQQPAQEGEPVPQQSVGNPIIAEYMMRIEDAAYELRMSPGEEGVQPSIPDELNAQYKPPDMAQYENPVRVNNQDLLELAAAGKGAKASLQPAQMLMANALGTQTDSMNPNEGGS
jgi:hypothetical protein